jgi:hypothetical protein
VQKYRDKNAPADLRYGKFGLEDEVNRKQELAGNLAKLRVERG